MTTDPDVRPPLSRELRALPATTTRSHHVAQSIRRAILSGELRPGDLLVERRLAEVLGVSKTPVREALLTLTSSGLIVSSNGRVTVRRLENDDLERIQQMRLLLEPWTTGCAAVQREGGVAEAREALKDAQESLSRSDYVGLSLANRRFHRSLYVRCHNEFVVSALDGLQDLMAFGAVQVLWAAAPTWAEEFAQHEQILAAVEDGQSERARQLMLLHISSKATAS